MVGTALHFLIGKYNSVPDPHGGRGLGKSTLAFMIGHLFGGVITKKSKECMEGFTTRLLSPEARKFRVALLDNLKGGFSDGDFEGSITAPVFSGHKMYKGEGQRDNTLTWFITVNGAALSKDMAQRAIPVYLGRPTYSGSWYEETLSLIESHRWEIIGDLLAELMKPSVPLAMSERWGVWERDVLSKCQEPAAIQELIKQRQNAADSDREAADLVREAFRADLVTRGFDTETAVVRYPAETAAAITESVLRSGYTGTQQITRLLNDLGIPEISSKKISDRGYVWRGPKAPPNAAPVKFDYRKSSP